MQIRRDFLRILEATIVGFFLIQSIRFLYASMFARASSADLVRRLADRSTIADLPGVVDPAAVQTEIIAVAAVFLAPLLALIIARTRWSIPLAVGVTVVARYMVAEFPNSNVLAAAVTVAGGLLYLTIIAVRRPRFLPLMIAAAVACDQILRSLNATSDPTFDRDYTFALGALDVGISTALIALAIFTILLSLLTTLVEREESRLPGFLNEPPGVLTGWGSLALGGILYLQFTVLGLPNAAAHWAKIDYYVMLPLALLATLLPLVPEVRAQAGNFLSTFDGVYRGWLWALLMALLMVIGKRFEGLAAGLTLAGAQFLAILTLWWIVRQPEDRPRLNPTPILVLFSLVIFLLLSVGDYFTYDYAFVRAAEPPFDVFSEALRGMKNMGLPLVLIAVVFACMPMILERQIIPWRQGRVVETLLSLLMVLVIVVWSVSAAAPQPVRRPLDPNCLRVATLNIHGGFTQFFAPNLDMVADTILRSGADIVLLQEVETGRITSGSIDQAEYLANRLNMNATFFAQNEELQGLAVLSRLDDISANGANLSSTGAQAGLQYVTYSIDESGPLHVYNVWLGLRLRDDSGQILPDQQQDQVRQFEEVNRLVAANHFGAGNRNEAPDRVVVGGTFNFDEDSPLYREWSETVLQDPFIGLFAERRDTLFTVDGRSARYDYIWLLNLVPSGINIDQRNLTSDHRPSVVAVGREAGRTCPG
jgi:endonuclease/exonuclease/phosphatase family metal-dependent hydrolase